MSYSINPDGQLTDSDSSSANQNLTTVMQNSFTPSPQQVHNKYICMLDLQMLAASYNMGYHGLPFKFS